MKTVAGIFCLIALLSITARAEVEEVSVPCQAGTCVYWWPKLPELKGWHQDKDQSQSYGVNALAPDGFSFANADAVMYALALSKPTMPETKSLDMLIADDKQEFLTSDPSMTVTEVGAVTTGDGTTMRSFTFFPQSKGNWEQVSYGEEGDYYLVFTLSSRSKDAFDKTQNTYREFLRRYKVKL